MSVFAMHTRALFDEAPYQRTFTARVLAVSDQGHFLLPDGSVVAVVGTQRDPLLRSMIWHQLEEGATLIAAGIELQGCLDWERRFQHMKMHTCLHLLCSIIDAPVTGCSIAADKGRLDFDLPESTLDKDRLTHALNELIEGALDVRTHMLPASEYNTVLEMTRTQAVAPPVLQGLVRVVDIPGVDIQPCGGTHVRNTREIGRVVCDKIEKKSRHNRRVTLRFA